jgi:hypothetical protein
MALQKRAQYWYGDTQSDLHAEITRYGKLNGYIPTQFASAVCVCGANTFRLRLDDNEGAAVRICSKCGTVHPIGDSDEYLAEAELEDRECICGGDLFEITVGVALYDGTEDVKWLYLGCRCPGCSMVGCYGDWKNEFLDYHKLLARV